MTGWACGNVNVGSSFNNLNYNDVPISVSDLPDVLNNYFTSVTESVSKLDVDTFNSIMNNLADVPDCFIVTELPVYSALKRVKQSKAVCDDFLSNCFLAQYADILAGPVCALINSDYLYILPTIRTSRYARLFIPYCILVCQFLCAFFVYTFVHMFFYVLFYFIAF